MSTLITKVHRMLRDAVHKHGVHVHINQSNRSARQAQEFHICHMFLYNHFEYQCPEHCGAGGRTISWAYLSDPTVKWKLIDDLKSNFLRTHAEGPARLKPGSSEWATPPDEHQSRQAMARFLRGHQVTGMAAPGVNGCGEPCGCKGQASKHVTGEACDLHGLELLGAALMKANPNKYSAPTIAVDSFLHEFGLCRPLAHLHGKRREEWHVEAIPHSLAHHGSAQHLSHHLKNHHHGGG
jgi:hypothetical protein